MLGPLRSDQSLNSPPGAAARVVDARVATSAASYRYQSSFSVCRFLLQGFQHLHRFFGFQPFHLGHGRLSTGVLGRLACIVAMSLQSIMACGLRQANLRIFSGRTTTWRVEVAGQSTNQLRVRDRREPSYYATFRA